MTGADLLMEADVGGGFQGAYLATQMTSAFPLVVST